MSNKKDMPVRERLRNIKAINKQLFDGSGGYRHDLGTSQIDALVKKQIVLMKPIFQGIKGLAEMGRIQMFVGSTAEIRKWLKEEFKPEVECQPDPDKRWRYLFVEAVNLFDDATIRIDSHIAKDAGKGFGKITPPKRGKK